MRSWLKCAVTSLVVLGFLCSFYARIDPDLNVRFTSGIAAASSSTNQNDNAPWSVPLPPGTHQDEHGCYHDHQPLGRGGELSLPVRLQSFACENLARFVPNLVLFGIFHPPRSQFTASGFCALHLSVNVSWRKNEITNTALDRLFTDRSSEFGWMSPFDGSKGRNHNTATGAA